MASLYPRRNVFIIVDSATQHKAAEVQDFLSKLNKERSENIGAGRVVLGFIREHLTSIIQVGDFVFNRPIKNMIRTKYRKFRHDQHVPLTGHQMEHVGRDGTSDILFGSCS